MINVTPLAVKYAALLLIEANQQTTTLEVKDLLRSMGYYAEQFEISTFMEQAGQELPLSFTTDDEGYRVYTLPPVRDIYDDDDDNDLVDNDLVDDDDDDVVVPAGFTYYVKRA